MYEAIVNGKVVRPMIESVLFRTDEVSPRKIEGIRRAAGNKLLEVAATALGPTIPLVIRDLTALDMKETYDKYTEETIASSAYDNISVDSATVADNKFLALIGCRILLETASGGYILTPLVTNLRFTVGGSVVAKWEMYQLFVRNGGTAGLGAGSSSMGSVAGVTESPIIVTQNTPIVVDAFGVDGGGAAIISYDGLVCEPEGQVLKP